LLKESRAKGRRASDLCGNHHVTVHGVVSGSRKCVNVTRRGKAPWVVELASSFTEGQEKRSWRSASKRVPRKRGARRPAATGVSEVRLDRERRKKYAERQPRRARRSGSCVVKRRVHRSPGRECRLVGQGRGASLEEMPVATRGTGTRSRSIGKQKSVVRIAFVLRGAPQGKPQGGRTSSKPIVVPLTRAAMGPEKGFGFGWSQKLAEKNRGEAALQRRVYKQAPERNGVRVAIRAIKSTARALGPV